MSLLDKESTELFLKGCESAFGISPVIALPDRFEHSFFQNEFLIDFDNCRLSASNCRADINLLGSLPSLKLQIF